MVILPGINIYLNYKIIKNEHVSQSSNKVLKYIKKIRKRIIIYWQHYLQKVKYNNRYNKQTYRHKFREKSYLASHASVWGRLILFILCNQSKYLVLFSGFFEPLHQMAKPKLLFLIPSKASAIFYRIFHSKRKQRRPLNVKFIKSPNRTPFLTLNDLEEADI